MLRNRLVYGSVFLINGILTYFNKSYIFTISFYVLLLIPIGSLIALYFTYVNLRLVSYVNQRVIVKGDKVNYIITLNNDSLFVYCPLKLKLIGDKILFRQQFVSPTYVLYPRISKDIVIPLECNYRGSYSIGVESITIEDFFHLFRFEYKDIETHEILVYPKLTDLKYLPVRNLMVEETNNVKGYYDEEHDKFKDIRNYEYGDPLNRIHWKLTAKYNEIMVKKFNVAVNNSSLLFMDMMEHEYHNEINIAIEDKLIESVVNIIHYMLKRNIACKLMYHQFSSEILDGSTFADFEKFYHDLAQIQFGESMNIGLFIDKMVEQLQMKDEMDEYNNIFVITSHMSKELYTSLTNPRLRNIRVTLFYVSPFDLVKYESNEVQDILDMLHITGVNVVNVNMDDKLEALVKGA